MSSIPNPLRYGLKFSQQVHPIDVQIDVWRTADTAGFDHIWPFDHLIALGPDPTALIFDGWTELGAIAAITKRARMGLNVTGNLYRHPGHMATIAVTVDHLSNGRLEFGIGTGWNEPEFTPFGLPFPRDRKSTRLNSSHQIISYAVFCLKKKKNNKKTHTLKESSNHLTTHKQ